MRVMQGIIREYGLHGQYSEALQADVDLAQDWWPGPDYEELDESSDVEDPEKKARDDLEEYKREVADKETLFQIAVIETACESVEYKQVHLDLEGSDGAGGPSWTNPPYQIGSRRGELFEG